MHNRYFELGNLKIQMNCPIYTKQSKRLMDFSVAQCDANVFINARPVSGETMTTDCDGYCNRMRKGNTIDIWWNTNKITALTEWHILRMAPLMELMLEHEMVVLHASYVVYRNKAILFCGPPRIGKSTQAELWHQERDAKIINGDRTLIFIKNGILYAGGYFISGSSKISLNEINPLKAIVLLDQGDENTVQTISKVQLFQKLLSQCAYDLTDKNQVECVIDLINKILSDVIVLSYRCRNETQAVDELEKYI